MTPDLSSRSRHALARPRRLSRSQARPSRCVPPASVPRAAIASPGVRHDPHTDPLSDLVWPGIPML